MATKSQKLSQKQWLIVGAGVIAIFTLSKYFAKAKAQMEKSTHEYRGIYDSGEVGRIEQLLADQRSMFNASDKKQFTLKEQFKKYGVILLGATVLLLTVKFIKK